MKSCANQVCDLLVAEQSILTTEEDVLAAVLLDMSDGRRSPRSRLSLYQGCQGCVWTGRLPPENENASSNLQSTLILS